MRRSEDEVGRIEDQRGGNAASPEWPAERSTANRSEREASAHLIRQRIAEIGGMQSQDETGLRLQEETCMSVQEGRELSLQKESETLLYPIVVPSDQRQSCQSAESGDTSRFPEAQKRDTRLPAEEYGVAESALLHRVTCLPGDRSARRIELQSDGKIDVGLCP
ncbi:hypothetical protein [Paenibacillus sp. HJGM_3]|uniref:hypothetical protein n=1 Tax=Paenibacillus sp. HJGM_3 TaxID=3379816 RepID=UPI00385DB9AC